MRRAAAIGIGLALAGCGRDEPAPRTSPLWSDGQHLRDAEGRIVLLRGINARVEGVFDVTFDDGRLPLEPIPALEPADCRRMRELGLDLLRLPINWSGIEPHEGAYDEGYLARVDRAIACAADAGLYVIVDLHQDGYSKEIGEDGAPLWAIVPPPEQLLGGPLTDLEERRVSAQVLRAFETFFDPDDPAELQAKFIDMLEVVASRWADHPMVIGFEIFNEPVVGQDLVDLFHVKAATRLRAAAPDKLIFFEPSAIRNLFDFVPKATAPFPVSGAVYAPHVYTYVFRSTPEQWEQLSVASLEPSVRGTREEARAWQTPLFIGEFGVGPETPKADLWMGIQNELHDRYLASNAFWLWKEHSQDRWGVHDFDEATGRWSEREQVVRWVSRVHAARIAGEVIGNAYDHQADALRLEVRRGSTRGVRHEVYVPERAAGSFRLACDGATVIAPRDPGTGLVAVACDGVLEITP
jgi:endoglycosylceramidase